MNGVGGLSPANASGKHVNRFGETGHGNGRGICGQIERSERTPGEETCVDRKGQPEATRVPATIVDDGRIRGIA